MRRRRVRYGMLRDGDIAEIWERWKAGEDRRTIAAVLGCGPNVVTRIVGARGGIAPVAYAVPPWRRSPRRLRASEREEISRGLRGGESVRHIARRWSILPTRRCG